MGYTLNFNPEKDIPDLSGKVFFITGGLCLGSTSAIIKESPTDQMLCPGTAGLGKQTLLVLAKYGPARIYFTGRNQAAADLILKETKSLSPVEVTFIECDHASLSSVENAAKTFLTTSRRLDVLICNAGVMAIPAGLTKDGYENQFGINHVAHAVFIKALLPLLQKTGAETGDARIVVLSSVAFRYSVPGGIVFKYLKTTQEMRFGRWLRYGQSKLANVTYALELSKRYPNITCVSLHPGVIWTGLNANLDTMRRLWLRLTTLGKEVSIEEGAYNTEWAVTTEKKNLKSGAFYEPVGVLHPHSKQSGDIKFGEQLWEWIQKEIDEYGNST
jgi:NAD(P)-dependent dehydrogenase (short-subunit alcohol dehydrogenase family)